MPVDPDDIEDIVAQISAIYREGEAALLRAVRDHLAEHPGAPTAWADDRLAGLASLRRAAASIQAAMEADGSRALRDGIASAWRLGTRAAVADLPAAWFPSSGIGAAADAARDVVPQTGAIEALASALVRDIGDRVRNILRDTVDAFRSAVAGGTARMLAAGQDRRTATQAAWSALVRQGVTGFTDRSGRRWRLHSYVEMAVRTASARAAVEGQTDRLSTLGVDLVYVSDHAQQCGLCRPWEGRILRLTPGPVGPVEVPHAVDDDRTVTVDIAGTVAYARSRGLWHPNCRHSASAYLPGVTRVPEPRNPDPDAYDARMRQRHIERRIRRWREQEQAATTDEARTAARRRVRAWQAEMRQHLADHPGLKRLRYRERVGAGSEPPGREPRDAATPLGPDVQPSIDGDVDPVRRGRRDDGDQDDTPDATRAPDVDEGQMSLDDAPADDGPDVSGLSPEELETAVGERMAAGDYDSPLMAALMVEMDRREAAERDAAARREAAAEQRRAEREAREDAQHARMAELVEAGYEWEEAAAEVLGRSIESIRRESYTAEHRTGASDRRSFAELAREQYRLHIERVYVVAETDCRGYLLNDQGVSAGIDPMSLFSGPRSRVERYASEELRAWFDANGRMNYGEFVESIEQGRGPDDSGRDFNR